MPFVFLAIWGVACIYAFFFSSISAVFEFAYFVLPLSSFVVPLCIAHLSCHVANRVKHATYLSKPSFVLSAVAATISVAAYGLSVSVIARFLELPWRSGKFGESTLDLGLAAAQLYSLAAFLTAVSALALLRASAIHSRYACYAIGSLSMLISASLIYFLFGISPLVHWHA